MATFTVTTAADAVDAGDGLLSLREATALANATTADDTIRFAGALEGETLTLTRGQLALRADVVIEGDSDADGAGVILTTDQASRVLLIDGTATDAFVAGVTITGGREAGGAGGGVHVAVGSGLTLYGCTIAGNAADRGGGIYAGADSRLEIRSSTIASNGTIYDASAPPDANGGGLLASGGAEVTIERSTIIENFATSYGGGLSLADGSSLALRQSQVAGNSSGTFYAGRGGGAGLHLQQAAATITASAIVFNSGGERGGGMLADASRVTFADSTVAGNAVSTRSGGESGGGILAVGAGYLALRNCTVTDNAAGRGYTGEAGGIGAPTLHLASTIVAGNTAGDYRVPGYREASDVVGTIMASDGHNIFGSEVAGSVAGDLEGIAPARLFAALGAETGGGVARANGGPTSTVALRGGLDNPALSGGEPVIGGEVDQRGLRRPLPADSAPDVGAFELNQQAVSRTAGTGNDVLAGASGADRIAGLAGADLILGREGGDRLNGGAGGDTLFGGFGDDLLDGGTGLDTASYRDAAGPVSASLARQSSTGALGADRLLRLENLEGGRFADRLEGDALANLLGGGAGDDRLLGRKGDDTLLGGGGADLLNGGGGADRLTGGGGRDLFGYDFYADSAPGALRRDAVLDFSAGIDRFDLAALDARLGTAADEAFTFLPGEGAAFTGAGQVRWFQSGGDTFIEASGDADPAAELQIRLAGLGDIAERDFLL